MNNINIEEYEQIKKENEELKNKNKELEERLKIYTNNESHKKYYEKNNETIKAKARNYMSKLKETNPEKLKEWRHNAYLKRKEKLQSQTTNSLE
jgi:cell division septum initiation protein DivIVA